MNKSKAAHWNAIEKCWEWRWHTTERGVKTIWSEYMTIDEALTQAAFARERKAHYRNLRSQLLAAPPREVVFRGGRV